MSGSNNFSHFFNLSLSAEIVIKFADEPEFTKTEYLTLTILTIHTQIFQPVYFEFSIGFVFRNFITLLISSLEILFSISDD